MVKLIGMKNLFKNPKTRLKNLLLVILPFIVLAFIFGFITYRSLANISTNTSGTAYKDSIDSMDYHLRDNATDLQEDLFKELQNAVKDGTDKANIAFLVCKNFVADFYTWTNKEATYDIGGMYYVYSPQRSSLYNKARNKYYKYLTYYIDTYGQDNLLEVTGFDDANCSVETEPATYTIDGNTYEAYHVKLTWIYKNTETFSNIATPEMDGQALGFVTWNYFTVIVNEEGRFEIVQAYGEV